MSGRKTPFTLVAVLPLAIALSGCVADNTIYHWGTYPDQVYDYFNHEPISTLIDAMEEQRHEAASSGRPLPPSFHAHLGLLYHKSGDTDRLVELLHVERDLYPESAGMIDFFLNPPG